jgi:serine/threonine protein kinase
MRRHDDTSGTRYIVKECRQGSDEVNILKFLQTLKPPCKHIVSLVETIETNAGTYVVLPERESVQEQLHCSLDGGYLRGMFLDLSRDLTIGLSFLHKNGIAHLDIKPSNLVYTKESRPRLEIIDFDIAVQVQNEEEEIDEYCGSKDWMAPEIGEEDGPPRLYSPMRADKWSCGRVLCLFAERHGKADEGLRAFAVRLMDGNPRNRPPLLEWHESRTKVVPEKRRRVDVDTDG